MAKRKEPTVEVEFSRLCKWATWASFAHKDTPTPTDRLDTLKWLHNELDKAIDEYKAKEGNRD